MKSREERNLLLAQGFLLSHPGHATRMIEASDEHEVAELFRRLSDDAKIVMLTNLSPLILSQLLLQSDIETIGDVVVHIPTPNLVQALRSIAEDDRQNIVLLLPAKKRQSVEAMLNFPAQTVAQLVDVEVLTLPPEATIKEAAKRIQKDSKRVQHYVYIVDRDRTLLGVCSVKYLLLLKNSYQTIADVMRLPVTSIRQGDVLEHALLDPGWQHWSILPVVDRENRFTGTVTYENMVRRFSELRHHGQPALFSSASRAVGEVFWQSLKLVTALAPVDSESTRLQEKE